MDRRKFLLRSTVLGATGVSWRLWAAPDGGSGSKFLFVFLRGGCDGLSALVPYAEPFYYESRPNIAIAASVGSDDSGAKALDARWAIHPQLISSLGPLFVKGELAFVPFSGATYLSRSHFQAQDQVELGQSPRGRIDYRNGFLNRLVTRLSRSDSPPLGVSFTSNLPIVMRGVASVPNLPLRGAPSRVGAIRDRYGEQLLAMYRGHELQSTVEEGLRSSRELTAKFAKEMEDASRGAVQPTGFALDATRVAGLMRENKRYSIGFIDVGGWDTHAGQGAASGYLANQLRNFGSGLAAFAAEMGELWPRTVVVVMSEFGRTFQENGSRGTDHGHGGVMWVLGGAIRGGVVRGGQADMRPGALHEGRDLPVLNDYRAVLGEIWSGMYGLRNEDLEQIFPFMSSRQFGLI